ncbi:initiation factor 2 subunit family protein [Xylariomycetidae sp. FL0641]|nr:initiation factor 2 subunit family protein [Xylariomycetidae sp. FL0641]
MAVPKGGYAPSLEKFLDTLKSRPVDASADLLISLLKRRQIQGSESCAIATARLLLQVVAKDKWTEVDQLLGRIQLVGKKLVAAQPGELAIGNVVRRVLGLIRDEASADRNYEVGNETASPTRDTPPSPITSMSAASSPAKPIRPPTLASLGFLARTQSMFNLLSEPDGPSSSYSNASTPGLSGASTPLLTGQSTNVYAFRSEIIEGIEEIVDEIKTVDEQVQAYSDIVIHPSDYVLVYQPSRTVQRFLTRAAPKRRFTVFLAVDASVASEAEDAYASFRKSMAASGSVVVTVMNAGLMAYMTRVNKVILGARAITAKGGVVVDAGAAVIARAARAMGRTVIVIGGVYKLSPESRFTEASLTAWGDPSKYVSYADGAMVSGVRVKSAVSEFIPSEHVDTYITNLGAHVREHLQTLITDHYKEEDIAFDLYGSALR